MKAFRVFFTRKSLDRHTRLGSFGKVLLEEKSLNHSTKYTGNRSEYRRRKTLDLISMRAKLNSTRSSSCSLHDIVHDEPTERNSSVTPVVECVLTFLLTSRDSETFRVIF